MERAPEPRTTHAAAGAAAASATALWHGFLDTLSDPLLVLDDRLLVSFANTAALRFLPCDPGIALDSLTSQLPAGLVDWVRRVVGGAPNTGRSPAPGCQLSRLNTQRWALRLPPPPERREPAGPPSTPAAATALAEMRAMFWDSPFPTMLQDEQFRLLDVNPAFVNYVGMPADRLLGSDPIGLVPEEDRPTWLEAREHLQGMLESREVPALTERRLLDAAGRERWFRAARRSAVQADGQRLRLTVMLDTTAEHVAREHADRSLRELDQWFDLSPVGMVVFDAAGLVLRTNAVFETLVGRVPVLLTEAAPALQRLLGWGEPGVLDALQPGGEAVERRGAVDLPAGPGRASGVRRLRARLRAADKRGAQSRYIAVVEDLTAQQALDLAQAQLGVLADAAGVGVAAFAGERGWIGTGALTATEPVPGHALASIGRELVQAESLPEFERLQRALRQGERAQARYAIRHPELGTRWLLTRVEPRPGGQGEQATSVVTLDVTEQERARGRSEELLRELTSILESSSAGIAYLRGNTLVRCNRRFERMLGLTTGVVAGSRIGELFGGQPQAARLVSDAEQGLIEAGVYETEFEIVLPGQEVQWVALAARRIGEAGPRAEVVAVLSDITRLKRQQAQLESLAGERQRTEDAMAQQADLTRAILDSVFVGIVTVGPEGIEWMNRSARRMFGGELGDFFRQPLATVATEASDHPFRSAPPDDTLGDGRTHSFECEVQARDGRRFWVVGNAVATGGASPDGRPQLTYALLDIDRRRQAEARTAQAQASLQRVIDLAPLAITLFDAATGRVRQLNPVAASIAGVRVDQAIGQTIEALQPPAMAGAMRRDIEMALASSGEVTRREYRSEHHGASRVWDARYLSLAEPGQAPDEVLLVATDVTEQRLAEAARLEAAIAQRERLVKEVHHRIKNNLQGVAGLLQQMAQRQPEVAPAIREAVGQVQAIAQVYGLQVGAQGPLQLASLVEAIAGSLQRAGGDGSHRATIGVQGISAQARRWTLPEAEAIPLALSLNELLANAVKHGGGADVECTLLGSDDEVRIEIRNRGRLPEGFSLDRVGSGVFGLGLVRALLPRRSALLQLQQEADRVLTRLTLHPPSVTMAS